MRKHIITCDDCQKEVPDYYFVINCNCPDVHVGDYCGKACAVRAIDKVLTMDPSSNLNIFSAYKGDSNE